MIRAAVSIAILLIAIAANAANVGITGQIPSATSRPRPGPNFMIGESGSKPSTGFTDEVYYEWNTDKWWKGNGTGWSQMQIAQGGTGGTVDQGNPNVGSKAWPVVITSPSDQLVKVGDPATGSIKVNVVAGSLTVGATTDKAAWSQGVTQGTPFMGARDDAGTSTLAEDTVGVLRSTQFRALHVNLRDASGNEITSLGGSGSLNDTIGTSGTLGAANATVSIATSGQRGANIAFAAGTLAAPNVIVECSANGSAPWTLGTFADMVTGIAINGLAFTNPNPAISYGVLCATNVVQIRVRVVTYTSGNTTAQMFATQNRMAQLVYGNDGTQLQAMKVTTGSAVTGDPGVVVKCASGCGGSGGTALADGGAVTPGTTQATPISAMRQDTPTSVANNTAGMLRMNGSFRQLLTQPMTSQGQDPWDTSAIALRVSPVTVVTVGGQNGPSTVAAYEKCETGFNLSANFTAGQVLEWVPLTAGQLPRICGIVVWPTVDTDITISRATTATTGVCGGTITTIAGPFRVAATAGPARPFVISAGQGAFFFGASGQNICLTSSVAGNLTAYALGTKY